MIFIFGEQRERIAARKIRRSADASRFRPLSTRAILLHQCACLLVCSDDFSFL